MINTDDVTKENTKEYNPNWPQIFDHLDRLLITGAQYLEKNYYLI